MAWDNSRSNDCWGRSRVSARCVRIGDFFWLGRGVVWRAYNDSSLRPCWYLSCLAPACGSGSAKDGRLCFGRRQSFLSAESFRCISRMDIFDFVAVRSASFVLGARAPDNTKYCRVEPEGKLERWSSIIVGRLASHSDEVWSTMTRKLSTEWFAAPTNCAKKPFHLLMRLHEKKLLFCNSRLLL